VSETTYRTIVFYVSPSPNGPFGDRWAVNHFCRRCRAKVDQGDLVAHAIYHEATEPPGQGDSSSSSTPRPDEEPASVEP
jgi:hypothetical protein